LHHLKAPMVDFMRRAPEPGEAVQVSGEADSFKAEASIEIEDVEVPARVRLLAAKTVAEAVSPAVEILFDPVLDRPKSGPPQLDPEERPRLILPPDPLPSAPIAPPSCFAVEDSAIALPTVALPTIALPLTEQRERAPRRRDQSVGWFSPAALTFAGVVLAALVLGIGMRPGGKTAVQNSGAAPREKVAVASTGVNLLSAVGPAKESGLVPALAAAAPAIKSEEHSDKLSEESRVAKTETATAAGAKSSHEHGDGLIARDTVTYLDERYRPAPKAKPADRFAGRHPSSHKHGGVVAANTDTNLNKPAPGTTK